MMQYIFCVLLIVAAACGMNYDGLRVKFGWSSALADIEYFYSVPRVLAKAEAEGWYRMGYLEPRYIMAELRLYCPPDSYTVCALYEPEGFIAGIQIAIPSDQFQPQVLSKYLNIHETTFHGPISSLKTYLTATQYFVSEESQQAGAGPTVANGQTLQDGAVWLLERKQKLMRVPATEAELNSTAFKKQNCIPNMGTHYYYNMTPEMKCEDHLPWFALVMEGELIGTGFQMFGKLKLIEEPLEWLEIVKEPRICAKLSMPSAPQCLYDWASNFSVISLHIYYVDKPWNIRCKDGDSIKSTSALERFLLNGDRYFSKVVDGVKSLFYR